PQRVRPEEGSRGCSAKSSIPVRGDGGWSPGEHRATNDHTDAVQPAAAATGTGRKLSGAYASLQTSSPALTPPAGLAPARGWAPFSPSQSAPRIRSASPEATESLGTGLLPGATCASAAACWSEPEPYCTSVWLGLSGAVPTPRTVYPRAVSWAPT